LPLRQSSRSTPKGAQTNAKAMSGLHNKSHKRSGHGLLLAALALGLRLILPGGVMLAAPSVGAAPQMVICTGQGAMTVSLGQDGALIKAPANKAPEKPERPDHPCAFAASVAYVGPSQTVAAAQIQIARSLDLPLATAQRPGLGLAAPPPWTTGPPTDFRLI
jgi:hypothetical protein